MQCRPRAVDLLRVVAVVDVAPAAHVREAGGRVVGELGRIVGLVGLGEEEAGLVGPVAGQRELRRREVDGRAAGSDADGALECGAAPVVPRILAGVQADRSRRGIAQARIGVGDARRVAGVSVGVGSSSGSAVGRAEVGVVVAVVVAAPGAAVVDGRLEVGRHVVIRRALAHVHRDREGVDRHLRAGGDCLVRSVGSALSPCSERVRPVGADVGHRHIRIGDRERVARAAGHWHRYGPGSRAGDRDGTQVAVAPRSVGGLDVAWIGRGRRLGRSPARRDDQLQATSV